MCWIVSDFLGQKGTKLVADNNVNIKAAEQNSLEESKNESLGWNAGVAVSYGSNGLAFGVTAGGNAGKGKGNGSETSYANSHVGSKDSQTIIQSGNATNIIGVQVQGKGIQIDAKELNVESLQDKATYKSKQQNVQGQVTVGYGASASGSASKTNINANYASVTGLKEVNPSTTPLDSHDKLNKLDQGKLKPAEAATGAQLESVLDPMKKYELSGGQLNKNPDWEITSQKHLEKADFVSVDFRVLNESNQKIFLNYIQTLPKAQRDKIIIVR